MSNGGNKGGGDEPSDKYREEADAKSSAISQMYSRLKIAFRGSDHAARQGEREADLAKRPNKNAAQDMPPLSRTPDALPDLVGTADMRARQEDGDEEGDGDGDTGKTGSGSGGGPAPDLNLTASDYTSFADGVSEGVATVKADKAGKKNAEQTLKVETAEQKSEAAKSQAAKVSGPAATTTGPGKSGGPGPATPGKSGGKSGGGGAGPSGP